METKPVFRASYTALSLWESDWERAIKYYFKLDSFTTPEMADGKEWHKRWQREVNETGNLPKVFGEVKLTDPKTELKEVIHLEDWLDLVGVIDLLDTPTIHEYKTGTNSSETYASTKQPGVYAYLAKKLGYDVKQVKIWHYNQYTKKKDLSIVLVTPKLLEDTENWIKTVSGQMHDYLLTNNLYERFGKR